MDFLVERMNAAGCSELRVVTRPEKLDVSKHAESLGASVVQSRPDNVSESIAAGLAGLSEDDIVLFGFPDTIWEPVDGFVKLREKVEEGYDIALGLFRHEEPERSDVVRFDADWLITGVEVKVPTPSSNWVWACGAARASVLSGIASQTEPGIFLDRYCKVAEVVGVWLSDSIVDIGTKETFRRVTGLDPVDALTSWAPRRPGRIRP
jgi:hypothetical protein